MKKNRTLRIAAVLMVLALVTTCVISGTFAKYVTGKTMTDSARVAKWTTFDIDTDSLFSNSYERSGVEIAAARNLIVAPGTNNADTEKTITFSNAPEVKYDLEFSFVEDTDHPFSDIVLAASGNPYTDPTGESSDGTFTLAEDYKPVVFTITVSGAASGDQVFEGSLTDLKAMAAADFTAHFDANEAVAPEITISWAWADEDNNAADTYLGQEDTLQTINFTLKVKAVQVFE